MAVVSLVLLWILGSLYSGAQMMVWILITLINIQMSAINLMQQTHVIVYTGVFPVNSGIKIVK